VAPPGGAHESELTLSPSKHQGIVAFGSSASLAGDSGLGARVPPTVPGTVPRNSLGPVQKLCRPELL
jgi:hypothetical protein